MAIGDGSVGSRGFGATVSAIGPRRDVDRSALAFAARSGYQIVDDAAGSLPKPLGRR